VGDVLDGIVRLAPCAFEARTRVTSTKAGRLLKWWTVLNLTLIQSHTRVRVGVHQHPEQNSYHPSDGLAMQCCYRQIS
jgi:hypothetical protein